jgi:hypothetical protein
MAGSRRLEAFMLANDELWLVEEPPIDAPSDLLTIPEVRNHVTHELHDDELGLRSLLERPEALSKSWWRAEAARRPRLPQSLRSARRRRVVLRAA